MKARVKKWTVLAIGLTIVAIVMAAASSARAKIDSTTGDMVGMLDRTAETAPNSGSIISAKPVGPMPVEPIVAPMSGYVASQYRMTVPQSQITPNLSAVPSSVARAATSCAVGSAVPQSVTEATDVAMEEELSVDDFKSKWGNSAIKITRPRLAGCYTNDERQALIVGDTQRYKRSTHERPRPDPTDSTSNFRPIGPMPVDEPGAIVLTSAELPVVPVAAEDKKPMSADSKEDFGGVDKASPEMSAQTGNSVNFVPATVTTVREEGEPTLAPAQSTSMQRIVMPEPSELTESEVELGRPRMFPVSYAETNFGVTGESEGGDPLNRDLVRSWVSDLSWRKGDFTFTPYGYVQVDTIWESQRTFPGDYALWVSQPTDGPERAFYIDAKSTRLGFDLVGPNIMFMGECLKTAARVEFDFQGALVIRNKPGVLFRQGYFELKNSRWRFLAGQTWDVISPLLPGNISYAPGFGSGSLGYRRAQLRAERYLEFNSRLRMDIQGSLNQVIPYDYARSTDDLDFPSGWPVVEGRLAWHLGRRTGPCARPIVFGISGHIGEERYNFLIGQTRQDVSRRTWSLNIDLKCPITERLTLRGEIFTGENLSSYLGGIFQGIDPGTRNTIRSKGGWIDLEYRWTDCCRSYFGYSVDDPFDQDMTTGRTLNQYYFANLIYNLTKQFEVGMDVSILKTLYYTGPAANATRLQMMMRYRF